MATHKELRTLISTLEARLASSDPDTSKKTIEIGQGRSSPPVGLLDSRIYANSLEKDTLRRVLSSVEKEAAELACARRRALNAQVPAVRIPDEVLSACFDFEESEGPLDIRSATQGKTGFVRSRYSVAATCHQWRQVALGKPSLWSHILIWIMEEDFAPSYQLRLDLLRSRSHPLNIEVSSRPKVIHLSRIGTRNLKRLLEPHMHRCRRFLVDIHEGNQAIQIIPASRNLPLLQELVVKWEHLKNESPLNIVETSSVPPRLDSLCILAGWGYREVSLAHLVPQNFTHLHLCGNIPIPELFTFLSFCVSLRHLVLDGMIPLEGVDPPSPGGAILELPVLDTLGLQGCTATWIGRRVVAPALRRLSLSVILFGDDDDEEWCDWEEWNDAIIAPTIFPRLPSLYMNIPTNVPMVGDFIAAHRDLEEIAFGTNYSDAFKTMDYVSCVLPNSEPLQSPSPDVIPCPSLREIRVRSPNRLPGISTIRRLLHDHTNVNTGFALDFKIKIFTLGDDIKRHLSDLISTYSGNIVVNRSFTEPLDWWSDRADLGPAGS